jgi:hypothetical protein
MAQEFKPKTDEYGNTVTPSTSGGDSSTPSQPQPTTPQQQGSGLQTGGFSNLKKFIDANKGEGQRMSQTIGQKADETRQKAETARAESANAFEKQRDAEQQRLASAQGLGEKVKQAGGAEEIAGDQSQLSAFQQAMSGQFNRPEYDLSQAQTLGSRYGELAGLSTSEPGRFELLRKTFQKPQYNTGMQKLDQLLLQTDPNGAAQLQRQLQQGATELGRGIQETQGSLTEQQAQLAGLAGSTQTALSEALGGQVDAFKTDLSGRVGTKQQEIDTELQRLQSGQLTAADLERLGFGNSDKMMQNTGPIRTYGLSKDDLLNYVSPLNEYKVTRENVLGESDIARARALEQLQGLSTGTLAGEAPAEIGNLVDYNKEGLQGELARRQGVLQNQTNDLQGQIGSSQELLNQYLRANIYRQRYGAEGGYKDPTAFDKSALTDEDYKYINPQDRALVESLVQRTPEYAKQQQLQEQLKQLNTQYSGTLQDILGYGK